MSASAKKSLTIIMGAGPGTGAGLGKAFAQLGGPVALLARRKESLESVQKMIEEEKDGEADLFVCDATSADSIKDAISAIRKRWPDHALGCACYNVNAPFLMKPFLELKEADLKPGLDLNVNGAFNFSQAVIPYMLENQGGTLLFSGATAALRGGKNLAAFAPSKFALRALSQSLAREFGPQGIHVAHVILDGLIDTPPIRERFGAGEEGKRLDPDAIGAAYVYIHQQPKTAWTQEMDLRPSVENF